MKLFRHVLLTCAVLGTACAQTSANSVGGAAATQSTAQTAGAPAQANSSSAAAARGGTVIPVELSKSIDSKKAKAGDEITAKVISDVRSGGAVAIPRGSKLMGKITEATARGKGDATSTLGIAFDRAVLKNGSALTLVSTIQAVIAPPETESMPPPASTAAGSMDTQEANRSGGSGAMSGVGNTAGSAVGAVGHTVDSATQTAAGDLNANARIGVNAPVITAQTTGVVGLKGMELNADAGANGPVLTTSAKSVKLENGTRILVNVSAASKAEATPPGGNK